jgi:hypothetical protein
VFVVQDEDDDDDLALTTFTQKAKPKRD